MEVNRASYEELLRVPGIGVNSAQRIVIARRTGPLDFAALKKLGVVLKRAQYFITCSGRVAEGLKITQDAILRSLMSQKEIAMYYHQQPWGQEEPRQLSLFDDQQPQLEEVRQWLIT